MFWDSYQWDALDSIEGKCMDGAYDGDKQCYPEEDDKNMRGN